MGSTPKLTMKMLADELELSVSVVSRVLNGKADAYRISTGTQSLVREAALKHGFSINQLARGLRLQKTSTIGLLIPDIANSFFSMTAREVEKLARHHGYSIILCDTENSETVEQQALDLLYNRSVDGLLVAPVGNDSRYIEALYAKGMPMVLVDRFFEDHDIPYVTSNNFQGAYAGTQHLIEHGHRRIGFIQGIPDSKPNLERLRGYGQALSDHPITAAPGLVVGTHFEEEDGYHSAMTLLTGEHPPTALLASSSVGALGVMRACLELGRSIPGDVSLIGFDEYPYAPLLAPPLTTIAQQTQSIAEAATHLLLEWLESGKRPERGNITLDTHLVSRASVGRI